MINPAPGVIDFDGYRALAPFYEAAREAGVWVILRPGPVRLPIICSHIQTDSGSKYINSESSAGGMARWVLSEVAGELRTNASDWRESYQQYIQAIIDESIDYQITRGGPIIGELASVWLATFPH